MSSSPVLGQFLWHELLTPDPAAGAGFYSKVFGWNARPWEGDADYTMLAHAKGPVGGARVIGKDPLADKAGANWLSYVGVADISAAITAVEGRGGRVIHPVTGLASDGGRYAVVTDPQGATIGLYQPGAGMSSGGGAMAGPVAWHELTADDPAAALQFYKAVFGWEVLGTHDMGGDVGTYYLFGIGTTQMGGAFRYARDAATARPRWLVYVHVPGVSEAVAATLAAGGKLLNGPHQVPGGNWVAQLTDSHGVMLAVHGPKEVAARASKAPAKPKVKTAAQPQAPVGAPAAARSKAKAKAKAKAKSKAKSKAKVKVKVKTKAQKKAQKKAKSQPKRKAPPKRKGVASRSKLKAKSKTKAKRKAKAKARKAPRRGK